jgi:hypothetical protein
MLLVSARAAAATPGETIPPPKTAPGRYLFVFELSKSMSRRAEGLAGSINDFLLSGIKGELREGDSIGVWTFNTTLSAGKFPLQTWPRQDQNLVAGKVITFLKDQKFGNFGRLDRLMPELSSLIKESQSLTVILITSGESDIQGTPFDKQINQAFTLWRAEQEKARMPFVTVLRIHEGKFAGFTVNPAQWPIELPPAPWLAAPQKPMIADKTAVKSLVTQADAQIKGALIFTGKKPSAPVSEEASQSPAVARTEPASAAPVPTLLPVLVAATPANSVTINSNGQARLGPDPLAEIKPKPPVPPQKPAEVMPAAKPASITQGTVSKRESTAGATLEPKQLPSNVTLAETSGAAAAAPKPVAAPGQIVPSKTIVTKGSRTSILGMPGNIFLAALIFSICLIVIFFLLGRYQRPRAQAMSLITRSLETSQKS